MKRCFIAADISEEARRIASDLVRDLRAQHPARGISWVKPENLHVTIKFLGGTDEATEAKVIEMLQYVAAYTPPFILRLERPEVLGKRVMSIKVVSDTPTIFALEQRIDVECERLGFKREGRRFHPHLTLGRIRDPRNASPLTRRFLDTPVVPAAFPVRHITLYQATLAPSGSIYSPLSCIPLSFV